MDTAKPTGLLSTLFRARPAWEVICRAFGIRPFLLPAPSAIWMAVVPIWPNIAMHTATTLRTVLLGLLASSLSAYRSPMLIASFTNISAAIYPLLVLTQSVPKVALAPILLVGSAQTSSRE